MTTAEVLTFGVEEELVLVDRRSGGTVPRAGELVAAVSPLLPNRVGEEFYAAQLEIRSAPTASATALRADLAHGRRVCASAAARDGNALVGSGCALLTGDPPPLTDTHRYRDIAHRLAPFVAATDSELSGCHIHLGTLDRADALRLSARLRWWLPTVQALAANSPFSAGRDRGHASWRANRYARWPTVGPAPVLSEEGYEALLERMVGSGEIRDRAMLYWYARPSERWPTLEIRLCDVNAELELDLLVAVLLRGLGTVLLAEARDGAPAPAPMTEAELCRAHRQAARYGLRGHGVDPETGDPATLAACLNRLVARARPGLLAAGDLALTRALLRGVRLHGTGADRQRALYARHGDLRAVVAALAARTGDG